MSGTVSRERALESALEEFDIEVPDEDAEKVQTIGDIYNYLVKQTQGGPQV